MNYFFIAIAFLVAVFMGWIITPQILLVAFRKRLFDSVGGRKTHNGTAFGRSRVRPSAMLSISAIYVFYV